LKLKVLNRKTQYSYNESQWDAQFSRIYLINYSTCFRQVHCPSSGVSQHCIHATGICHASSVGIQMPTELAWQIPVACVQCWDTPDDAQWPCLKHVE